MAKSCPMKCHGWFFQISEVGAAKAVCPFLFVYKKANASISTVPMVNVNDLELHTAFSMKNILTDNKFARWQMEVSILY
jgi:hypothetical protein